MASLPTLDRLGVAFPENVNALQEATLWLSSFSKTIISRKVDEVVNFFLGDAFVRDLFALTWDIRCFQGSTSIKTFVSERVSKIRCTAESFKLNSAKLEQPGSGMAWIRGNFTFETDTGLCSGIVRLVPTAHERHIIWKAYILFTNLEDLKGFPEQIGSLRNFETNQGKWAEQRRKEIAFEDVEPNVLIIGAGQSGLCIAARLKALGVSSLIIEQHRRIGDNWRSRYKALCLHNPVWGEHLPYMP
jgi:hypothetical protein